MKKITNNQTETSYKRFKKSIKNKIKKIKKKN